MKKQSNRPEIPPPCKVSVKISDGRDFFALNQAEREEIATKLRKSLWPLALKAAQSEVNQASHSKN